MTSHRAVAAIAALAAALVFGAGCATNRGEINVSMIPPPDNPSGKAVGPVTVVDNRHFELSPNQPFTPSLKDGQITNKEITLRAVARKRNGFGMALGDILLPEGRTVESVVKEAVVTALRKKGYSVKDAPPSANAIPVDVEIIKFWSWFNPGFWTIRIDFETVVVIKSQILKNGKEQSVDVLVSDHGMMATEGGWTKLIQRGVEELSVKIQAQLNAP